MGLLSDCTLTYFNLPGRGEPIRLALSIGGISYKEDFLEFKDWPEKKSATPWGSLPYLTLTDGSKLAQTRAILRYVGKETGLYPTADALLAERCDEVMDVMEDIVTDISKMVGQGLPAEEKAAKRLEAIQSGSTFSMLMKLDQFIADHGKNGFAVGDSLTVCDLQMLSLCCTVTSGMLDGVPMQALDGFANIQKALKCTANQPKVKEGLMAKKDAIPKSFLALYE